VQASTLNPDGKNSLGIGDLKFKWTAFPTTVQFTDAAGLLNTSLTLAATLLPATTYHLIVTGTALANGGSYYFSVAATPLPAALVLFGSGLVGLGLLGRRRRPAVNTLVS
jgi:hypothetical protein